MDQADTVGRMAEAASNFLAGLDAKGQQQAVIDFADTVERITQTDGGCCFAFSCRSGRDPCHQH